MAKFIQDNQCHSIQADLGAVGAKTPKTTEFIVSTSILPIAERLLGHLRDTRNGQHGEHSLIGGTDQNYSRSRDAAIYSSELWRRLAIICLSPQPSLFATSLPTLTAGHTALVPATAQPTMTRHLP